jgi:LPPG:FO 2-phospho-L-lactate transferase
MQITVLAGGVGGAKFLQGVRHFATTDGRSDHVTAIVNTGDDVSMHGMRICPDLDSVMYTLSGSADTDRGWGRQGESWRIMGELIDYGAEPTWFSLGDLDIATHLVRTQMLSAGYLLSDVTAALCQKWPTGITLLPMSDDRCETHVVVELDGAKRAIHFQEWWVRHRAALPASSFVQVGLAEAKPAAGVIEAIVGADLILIAPSNPVVSIDTILNIDGIRAAVHGATAPVVGLSPIIAGAPVRGMADACLTSIGLPCTAASVAGHYGARAEDSEGILDYWLVHSGDDADLGSSTVGVFARDLYMRSPVETAAMVADAARLAGVELNA